jgi:hypothetical protein
MVSTMKGSLLSKLFFSMYNDCKELKNMAYSILRSTKNFHLRKEGRVPCHYFGQAMVVGTSIVGSAEFFAGN